MCNATALRNKLQSLGKWGLGLALLGLVVVIWVGGSVFIQFIFTNQDFTRPFFLTYYNTCLFSIYLLGFAIFPKWRKPPEREAGALVETGDENEEGLEEVLPRAGWKETAIISAVFCPIWFLANYSMFFF
jgi:solute carrier family 35 protein F5